MFILKGGKVKTILMPVTGTTAIAQGALVTFSSGKLIAATSSTATNLIVGVLKKAIAATDADYTTDGRLVEVIVPVEKNTEWEFDCGATLVAGDLGTLADLTDSVTVNRGASSIKVVRITKVISTTKGRGIILFA
jgi:hypothetical protein